MKVLFLGATHEVTGSSSLISVGGKHVLIDCGMEQGQDLFENQELPISPSLVDAVLVTHAHIDHAGLVPMLYAKGFRGSVFVTRATGRLCQIMLRDSAHIQEFEAEWRNRKAKRAGLPPYEPVYTMQDVEGVLQQFVPCDYNVEVPIVDGVTARFTDAGHLLGSSSITLTLTEGDEVRRIIFSGDIGNTNKPILRDPQCPGTADYVVMESTYGDRSHAEEKPDYVRELAAIIQRTFDRGGNVVIPAFAVGRTQELLYFIRQIKEDGLVTGHGEFPVVVDSPLAVEATKIFSTDVAECYDKETMELLNKGINPITFPGLRVSVTADDSRMINADKSSKVIISASGMCEAGRIRHHLKHNLWRGESTVLFVGYQSVNTVGWQLLQGAAEVKLFGERIAVNAEIAQLHSVSGHADDNGLLRWAAALEPKPTRIFVNHGDEGACERLAERLRTEQGQAAEAPYSGDAWDLIANAQVEFGSRRRLVAKARKTSQRGTTVYERLLAMAARLMRLVESFGGRANKDIAKLTAQIQTLCEKWEK